MTMSTFANCTSVTPLCPVEATTYGYYPDLGANAALCAVFGLVAITQVIIGFSSKVHGYSIAVACGSVLECLGYAGRLMMHNNPWGLSGFKLQIVCLIVGPSFAAAGVYLTLKHIVLHYGLECSRIKPAQYPWIFVCCDVASIVLQSVGGGVAGAAGKTDQQLLNVGNNIIIAGISFQVATMAICGFLAVEYIIRLLRQRNVRSEGTKVQKKDKMNKRAQVFQVAVGFAYLTILIRSIYRLPEMAGGWGSEMMRNEKEFLILDGFLHFTHGIPSSRFLPNYEIERGVQGRTHTIVNC
ncbi:putative RTA1 domain protein [Pestalotiopsis sp. NC0098]|nr:putative RTA1 domain protein [Pestalotiopsis sp. NC0098]